MKSINITLKLSSINDLDELEVQTSGIMLNYMKNNYIITVHQGLPVKKIIIQDKVITNFTLCGWNDLIIIPYEACDDLFVFKHFVKKQINLNTRCYFDDINIKFIENDFLPINMIPGNPSNLYYKMKISNKTIVDGDAGKPIYYEKKLIGIMCKLEDEYIYVVPTNYILRSLDKKDNKHIYSLDLLQNTETESVKIGFYKVINNMIYCKKLNIKLPIESYTAFEGDIDTKIHFTIKDTRYKTFFNIFTNKYIMNKHELDINKNIIHINSCFIHLMKIYYKYDRLIIKIFENIMKRERFEFDINDIKYSLCY